MSRWGKSKASVEDTVHVNVGPPDPTPEEMAERARVQEERRRAQVEAQRVEAERVREFNERREMAMDECVRAVNRGDWKSAKAAVSKYSTGAHVDFVLRTAAAGAVDRPILNPGFLDEELNRYTPRYYQSNSKDDVTRLVHQNCVISNQLYEMTEVMRDLLFHLRGDDE